MNINSLNPVSPVFKGRTLPEFVNCHYINIEHSREHPIFLHMHENRLELYMVLEGEARYFIDDKFYLLQKGDIAVINQGVSHGESPLSNEANSSISIGISNLFIDGMPENCLADGTSDPIIHTRLLSDSISGIFKTIYVFSADMEHLDRTVNSLTTSLVLMVHQGLKSNSRRMIRDDQVSEYTLAKSIQHYLDENYRNDMKLDDIFENLHLSVSYASHIFKKYFNVSPKKYILEHRLGEAQQMLQSSNLSIVEISEKIGFGSPNHFITIFRKYTGCTPRQYQISFQEMKLKDRF